MAAGGVTHGCAGAIASLGGAAAGGGGRRCRAGSPLPPLGRWRRGLGRSRRCRARVRARSGRREGRRRRFCDPACSSSTWESHRGDRGPVAVSKQGWLAPRLSTGALQDQKISRSRGVDASLWIIQTDVPCHSHTHTTLSHTHAPLWPLCVSRDLERRSPAGLPKGNWLSFQRPATLGDLARRRAAVVGPKPHPDSLHTLSLLESRGVVLESGGPVRPVS